MQDPKQCSCGRQPMAALLLQRAARGKQRPPHWHHVSSHLCLKALFCELHAGNVLLISSSA